MSDQPKDLLTRFLSDTIKWTATRVAHAAGYERVENKPVTNTADSAENGLSADMSAVVNAFGPFLAVPIKALSVKMIDRTDPIEAKMKLLTESSSHLVKTVVKEANVFLNDEEVNKILKEFVETNKQILITMSPLLEEVIEQMVKNGTSTASQIAIAMVNIIVDSFAAVPGFGSFVNMAKIGNNVTFMMLQLVVNAKNMLVISSLFLDKFRKVMHATSKYNKENNYVPGPGLKSVSSAYDTVALNAVTRATQAKDAVSTAYKGATDNASSMARGASEKINSGYKTFAPMASNVYDNINGVRQGATKLFTKQSGGGAAIRERKVIERRINKSMREFINPMSVKRKTRRKRR